MIKQDFIITMPIGLILFLLLIVLLLVNGCTPTNDIENALSNFCKRRGYNTVTDTKPEIHDAFYTYNVECDNEHRYFMIECDTEVICHEKDKWHDCINESLIFMCS